jgi:hypothetical protein
MSYKYKIDIWKELLNAINVKRTSSKNELTEKKIEANLIK